MFHPDFLSFEPQFHVTISDRPSLSVCLLECFHIYFLIVISDYAYPEPVSHVGAGIWGILVGTRNSARHRIVTQEVLEEE